MGCSPLFIRRRPIRSHFCLHTHMIVWRGWSKLAVVIDEDPDLILDMNDHIGLAIVVDIPKLKSIRGKVLSITEENRTNVDNGFGTVCSWTFNDLNMAVQIESDEMT